MSRAYLFLATGFEEVEALTVVDLLRRAGVELITVSVSDHLKVIGSHRIPVEADVLWEDGRFTDGDAVILPGGMPGTKYLMEHEGLRALVKQYAKEDKYVAAICAAPTVLGDLGLLEGKRATCYPGLEEKLIGAEVVLDRKVVRDGRIITSRGVGTAIPFSLKLIDKLVGEKQSGEIAVSIVYSD